MKNIIPYNIFEMAKYDNLYLHKCFIDIVDRVNFDIAQNSFNIVVNKEDSFYFWCDNSIINDIEQLDRPIDLVTVDILFDKTRDQLDNIEAVRLRIDLKYLSRSNEISYYALITIITKERIRKQEIVKEIYLRNLVNTDKIVNDFYHFCNDCIKEAHKIN
jgi:hypothetical protein